MKNPDVFLFLSQNPVTDCFQYCRQSTWPPSSQIKWRFRMSITSLMRIRISYYGVGRGERKKTPPAPKYFKMKLVLKKFCGFRVRPAKTKLCDYRKTRSHALFPSCAVTPRRKSRSRLPGIHLPPSHLICRCITENKPGSVFNLSFVFIQSFFVFFFFVLIVAFLLAGLQEKKNDWHFEY